VTDLSLSASKAVLFCFFRLPHVLFLLSYFANLFFVSYFTELAEELPDDTLILTLGCAKNRIIRSEKLSGATLSNGMPRILDMGQCNDSYSAVVVATELAKALDCSVNDLPLSVSESNVYIISCFRI
jgi:hydroxylamine reductase (hybrid-cluster protein)